MPIFEPKYTRIPGKRTNTKLIVSGGASPAEHFIVDPDLPVLFTYDFGGPGQKDVVISKGMVVGVLPKAKVDYATNKTKTVLTIANDGKGSLKAATPVGLAPYNYAKSTPDFFDGNQPAIITRDYVELPWIPNAADAAEVKWGAVHGGLEIGDLVTFSRDPQNYGKLVKWEEGKHKVSEIVGQVLALETDQEMQGWLKWALWDEAAKQEDLGPKKGSYVAPPADGFPFDPAYREGTIDMDGYLSQYTSNPTGVPGLLDGRNRSETVLQTNTFETVGEGVLASVDLGYKNIVRGSVKFIEATLTEVETMDELKDKNDVFHVDYTKGRVHYKVSATNAKKNVKVQFRANFYGTPTHLDFKGVMGAARILLRF